MKEVLVVSGKGGTGKTSLVACFAALGHGKVLADCDVDAANLHLLLHPIVRERHEFRSGHKAYIDQQKCTACGTCQSLCRFGAISGEGSMSVAELSCEGCGLCARVCPAGAVTMRESLAGHWYLSETPYGPMVHARLGIAEENSGKLVAQVRKQARRAAEEGAYQTILTDGPPGIGCPVISSLSGVDLALLVTEPTLSGLHDLDRISGLCCHFNVPGVVCINKFDLNEENSRKIEVYCHEHGLAVGARIAFDPAMTRSLVEGIPLVKHSKGDTTAAIETLWQFVEDRLRSS